MSSRAPAMAPGACEEACCEAVYSWSKDAQPAWAECRQPTFPTRYNHKGCLGTANVPPADVTVITSVAEVMKSHTPCLQHFKTSFNMPEVWFTEYSRKSNGYFGCDVVTDDKGKVTAITTWCRFLIKAFFLPGEPRHEDKDYWWDKLNMFTRWDAETNKTVIVFFRRPMLDKIKQPQEYFGGLTKKDLEDPFWMYTFALGEILTKQNTSVWEVRTKVRDKEKDAEKADQERKANYRNDNTYRLLHDLARHTIHGTETLEATVATVELLAQEHDSMKELLALDAARPSSKTAAAVLTAHRKQHCSLKFQLSALRSLLHRSISNKERLLNEINLVFNTVAQHDASTSHDLAKASRLDSAAMKTIAFVTTAFLPATFIAAIFSTSFFNFEQDKGWDVSPKFWIYWVCAVPVTVLAVVSLHYWQAWFVEDGQGEKMVRMSTWNFSDLAKMPKMPRPRLSPKDSKDTYTYDTREACDLRDIETGRDSHGLKP